MKKSKKKLTKKNCEVLHSKKRSVERFGIDLNKERRRKLIDDIKNNKTVVLEKQSNRVTKHLGKFPDTETDIVIVYDKIRKTIVTIWKY